MLTHKKCSSLWKLVITEHEMHYIKVTGPQYLAQPPWRPSSQHAPCPSFKPPVPAGDHRVTSNGETVGKHFLLHSTKKNAASKHQCPFCGRHVPFLANPSISTTPNSPALKLTGRRVWEKFPCIECNQLHAELWQEEERWDILWFHWTHTKQISSQAS